MSAPTSASTNLDRLRCPATAETGLLVEDWGIESFPWHRRYLAEACPDYKLHGFCALGNECPFAHGVFEINLHPSKYRTQMCVEGCKCTRKMCFFAHNEAQLRQPDFSYGYRNTAEAVRPLYAPTAADVMLFPQIADHA